LVARVPESKVEVHMNQVRPCFLTAIANPLRGSIGVTVFPDELYPAPESWAKQACPKLVHYNRVDAGGHFAAWESGLSDLQKRALALRGAAIQ
jgi:hypothetical protein